MTGIVLAGGRSTRFGSDKLAVRYLGMPLLHHAVLRLGEITERLVVVVAPGAEPPPLPPGVRADVVHDAMDGQGPLAGLAAGLGAVSTGLAVAAGGDMPDLSTAVLVEMLRVAGEASAEAVALADGDRFRPLPLVVRVAPAREAAHVLLHEGERRLHTLPQALRTAVIDETTWRDLDPGGGTLRDVDVPADLPPE